MMTKFIKYSLLLLPLILLLAFVPACQSSYIGRNGRQMVSADWEDHSTSLKGSIKIWKGVHYKDFWWIYPEKSHFPESYAAAGHLGQHIFISPQEYAVVVRFGKNKGGIDGVGLFRRLSKDLKSKEHNLFV